MSSLNHHLLSSWNDGPTKQSIIDFVNRITSAGSDFVSPADRIAVFDNDGTLWCEKPVPIQVDFVFRRIAKQGEENPSLCDEQPWKAVVEKDYKWLSNVITKHYNGDDRDLKLMAAGLLRAYAGESIDSFAQKATCFLHSEQNPVLKRPYLGTAYAPMVELLQYLKANGFTNYIASGGTRDFMRTVTEQLYGITPEHVIGSSAALEYKVENGIANVYHKPELELFDDGPEKAVRIWSRIGKRPIFAAGNANGDIQMLEFTAHPSRPSHCLVVNHNDNDRDIAYTEGAEKLIDVARTKGWTVISVKDDWHVVFGEIASAVSGGVARQ
jgi:phosphoglycolate phosphatase-like HAD superfamily hydrolase